MGVGPGSWACMTNNDEGCITKHERGGGGGYKIIHNSMTS